MSWEQVFKGLMDLYNGMRLGMQAFGRSRNFEDAERNTVVEWTTLARPLCLSADSGAEGALSSDAGTRVGRFKR